MLNSGLMLKVATGVCTVICLFFFAGCDKYSKLSTDQKIEALIEKSQSQMALQQTPKQAEPIVQQFGVGLSEGDQNKLREKITEILSAESLAQQLRVRLKTEFTDKELVEVLKFTDSKLATTMQTLLNQVSNDPTFAEKIQIFQSEMQKNPPSKKREELIKKYDQLSGMSELTIGMMVGSAELMLKLNPPRAGQPNPMEYIRSAGFMEMLKGNTQMGFYYAFKDISDAEIEKYLDFLNSSAGKKYTSVMNGLVRSTNSDLLAAVEKSAMKKPTPAAIKKK